MQLVDVQKTCITFFHDSSTFDGDAQSLYPDGLVSQPLRRKTTVLRNDDDE